MGVSVHYWAMPQFSLSRTGVGRTITCRTFWTGGSYPGKRRRRVICCWLAFVNEYLKTAMGSPLSFSIRFFLLVEF